jgi:hypothetical protein
MGSRAEVWRGFSFIALLLRLSPVSRIPALLSLRRSAIAVTLLAIRLVQT